MGAIPRRDAVAPRVSAGHSTVSGAAVRALESVFGPGVPFTIDSETMPGTVRSYASFAEALADIHDARVFGGIHFRTACRRGSAMGAQVADWVIAHAMGDHRDQ